VSRKVRRRGDLAWMAGSQSPSEHENAVTGLSGPVPLGGGPHLVSRTVPSGNQVLQPACTRPNERLTRSNGRAVVTRIHRVRREERKVRVERFDLYSSNVWSLKGAVTHPSFADCETKHLVWRVRPQTPIATDQHGRGIPRRVNGISSRPLSLTEETLRAARVPAAHFFGRARPRRSSS